MTDFYKNFVLLMSEASFLSYRALSKVRQSNLSENEAKILVDEFSKSHFMQFASLRYLYDKYSDIKPDRLKEEDENPKRLEELDKIFDEAFAFMSKKDYLQAKAKFRELLQKAEFGYYKQEAEIMLYKCGHLADLDKMQIKEYQTYEKLDEIYRNGLNFENEKEFVKAIEIYKNLLKISKYSEFENKAMAGLYRCEKALNIY